MPRRKTCGHLGCINLTDGGVPYCPEHQRQRGWPRKTGVTRTDTAAHRKRRERVLKRDGHRCQLRYDGICTHTATICDHIVPLAEGGQDTDAGCQAACLECHRRKTSMEGHRARGHTVPSEPRSATKPAGVAGPPGSARPATPGGQRRRAFHGPSGSRSQLQ